MISDSPNTKSLTYRSIYLPGYNNTNERCDENQTMSSKQLQKAMNWNTYQQNTWYQTYLNHLDREECPIGVQGEFRTPGLAESKVSLMESGKWKAFMSTKDSKWDETFRNSVKDDDDFYAPETGLHNTNFRPHTTSGSSVSGRPAGFNQTKNNSEIGKNTAQSVLDRPISFNETRNVKTSSSQDNKTPPINPKTMFLQKTQKPLFGSLKETQKLSNTSASSSMSPTKTNSVRFDDTRNGPVGNQQTNTSFAATLPSEESQQALPFRPMSSQALSRRHMGVPLEYSSESNKNHGETYNSKMLTLKASNQLNFRPLDNTTDGFTMSSYLNHTNAHPHPHSGYDRGLKGTLLIDDWRKDELMKGDGKICFRPLSYDVLETLTYGPPDPSKKLSHEQNFPSLPPNRSNLIQSIFSCLLQRTNSLKMITIQQFLQYYDPSNHPAVKSNRVTIEQVLQGIIFDMLGEDIYQQYGSYENVLLFTINYEQFEYHYRAVSSVIYSDEYFENIVRSTWKYFHNELPKSRLMLIAKYSSRIDTADFETVLKSNGKKTK